MNVELMLRVADEIERENLATFNMHEWIDRSSQYSCGTAACVAGFVCLIERKGKGRYNDEYVWDDAKRFLGLSIEDSDNLFFGGRCAYTLGELSGKMKKYVPDALRWMALTETINWNKAIKMAKCVAKAEKKAVKAEKKRLA